MKKLQQINNYEICRENDLPRQSSLYMSTISSPDLKFCPDLLGDLKSKSYFVPTLWANKNAELQLFHKKNCIAQELR